MADRPFRTQESIDSVLQTRTMLRPFLEERGFSKVVDKVKGQSHAIDALAPWGDQLKMSVRLCWRRTNGRELKQQKTYSAAQLLSDVRGDWDGSLKRKFEREEGNGVTHLLLVQAESDKIVDAALIPLSAVIPIWTKQRDISKQLISEGKLGRRTKNHAQNGSSPTLWLKDDKASDVAAALWNYPGVRNLTQIEVADLPSHRADSRKPDDSDYVPGVDDGRSRVLKQIVERRGQQSFRDSLRDRYGDKCLVTGCCLLDVLEAAHIKPYRGSADHHVQNGLLLRADIHTLFDLNLLGIEPTGLTVELHPTVEADVAYSDLKGKNLQCGPDNLPSRDALRTRHDQFKARLNVH